MNTVAQQRLIRPEDVRIKRMIELRSFRTGACAPIDDPEAALRVIGHEEDTWHALTDGVESILFDVRIVVRYAIAVRQGEQERCVAEIWSCAEDNGASYTIDYEEPAGTDHGDAEPNEFDIVTMAGGPVDPARQWRGLALDYGSTFVTAVTTALARGGYKPVGFDQVWGDR